MLLSGPLPEVDHEEIDKINILNASFKAMHLALDKLQTRPQLLLIDGNRFKPYSDVRYECIIKGDGRYLSIAAGVCSCQNLSRRFNGKACYQFPVYSWETNVGYPTEAHRAWY
jgi:ribonuclease HII